MIPCKTTHLDAALAAPTIRLLSGVDLPLLDTPIEQIRFEDIALGLSREPRFGGHTRADHLAYVVALHSIILATRVGKAHRPHALLHDGAEGLGFRDLPSPLKHLPEMAPYRALERGMQARIYRAFGLDEATPEDVKRAELELLEEEIVLLRDAVPQSALPDAFRPRPQAVMIVEFYRYAHAVGLRHVVHGPVEALQCGDSHPLGRWIPR
jgi:hypothetical protein